MNNEFISEYLNDVSKVFEATAQCAKRHGYANCVTHESGDLVLFEWISCKFYIMGYHSIEVQAIVSEEIHIIVRSQKRKTKDKVLLKLEYLKLSKNLRNLSTFIVKSMVILNDTRFGVTNQMKCINDLRALWLTSSIRIVD